MKNMLDYSIGEGRCKPLIVVFPSYYKEEISRVNGPDMNFERGQTLDFMQELTDILIPALEGTYRTFLTGSDEKSLKESRQYRCFGGFSMGACTTWYTFTKRMDYFKYFMPLSGDCWEVEGKGGLSKTCETVDALCKAFSESGYEPKDFHIFAATGTEDIAYEPLTTQIEEMKKRTELFQFDEDYAKGNLNYLLEPGRYHSYEEVYHYCYNFLPYLF